MCVYIYYKFYVTSTWGKMSVESAVSSKFLKFQTGDIFTEVFFINL